MRRFEYNNAKSIKVYEVEVKGMSLQVTFGELVRKASLTQRLLQQFKNLLTKIL